MKPNLAVLIPLLADEQRKTLDTYAALLELRTPTQIRDLAVAILTSEEALQRVVAYFTARLGESS